jgi:SAM-dependent methyltransferase
LCASCGASPSRCQGFLAFAPALARSGDDDVEYHFDALARAESTHFWFVNRAALIVWALKRYAGDVRAMLEIGCGTGGVTAAIHHAFPRARMVAGEAQLNGLLLAQQKLPDVEFLQVDARRLPFDAEFDAAGAFDVIEHLDDDVAAVRAMGGAVVPGGLVLIAVPQHPWLWSEIDDFSHHRRRYTRASLRAAIESAGLEILRMTSFTTIVLPLMLLSRLKPGPFRPDRELSVSAAANTTLRLLSTIERAAIRAGVSLPLGGSLLAVARRPDEPPKTLHRN